MHTVLIVIGILATTAGMLLLAPLGIQALAAFAARAPIAMRLALRDLARYQARSGAALAAASLAVGIAATIASPPPPSRPTTTPSPAETCRRISSSSGSPTPTTKAAPA